MRRSQLVRIAILGLAGLLVAGGIGYAAHLAAGDEVGLSAGGIAAGDRLAPPEAATGAAPAAATDAAATKPGAPLTDAVGTAPPTAETGTVSENDATPTTTTRARTTPVRGRQVFAQAGCGQCHTLAAAKATGDAGPNLDRLAPTRAEVIAQVRSGGGGMPSFAGTLTEVEIRAVAAFVDNSTRPAPAPAPAEPGDDSSGSGSDDDVDDDSSADDSGRGRGRGRGGDDRDD